MTYSKRNNSVMFYVNNKKLYECNNEAVMPNVYDLIVLEDIASENAITIHSYMIFNKSILDVDEIETIYNDGIPPSYYTH